MAFQSVKETIRASTKLASPFNSHPKVRFLNLNQPAFLHTNLVTDIHSKLRSNEAVIKMVKQIGRSFSVNSKTRLRG